MAGGGGALGPWIGGILTTDYSWRWAFRINVIVAPIAIIAAVFYVQESHDERAKGIDLLVSRGVAQASKPAVAFAGGVVTLGR